MEIDISTGNNCDYRLSSGKLIGYIGIDMFPTGEIDMFPTGTEVDVRIPRGE